MFPGDHRPPHVHVFGPGAEAKFTIGDFVCYYNRGFKKSAIRELAEFLEKNKTLLLEAWDENQNNEE